VGGFGARKPFERFSLACHPPLLQNTPEKPLKQLSPRLGRTTGLKPGVNESAQKLTCALAGFGSRLILRDEPRPVVSNA